MAKKKQIGKFDKERLTGTGNEFVIKKPVSPTRDKPFRPTQ